MVAWLIDMAKCITVKQPPNQKQKTQLNGMDNYV